MGGHFPMRLRIFHADTGKRASKRLVPLFTQGTFPHQYSDIAAAMSRGLMPKTMHPVRETSGDESISIMT